PGRPARQREFSALGPSSGQVFHRGVVSVGCALDAEAPQAHGVRTTIRDEHNAGVTYPGGPPHGPYSSPRGRQHPATKPVPTWGSDLRRMLIVAGFVAVLWTIFMLVSATGLLRTNNLDQVEPDGVWAGILAGLGPALWAYSLVSFKREDNGFRRTGLPGLVILGAPFAAAIQLASMLVWPLVVDKLMHGQTVIATYSSDPLAFGLAAAFVIAMYAWCLLCL